MADTALGGYDRTANQLSDGVLDGIDAKAIVFDSGKKFLLVTVDVGAIGLDLLRRIASKSSPSHGNP